MCIPMEIYLQSLPQLLHTARKPDPHAETRRFPRRWEGSSCGHCHVGLLLGDSPRARGAQGRGVRMRPSEGVQLLRSPALGSGGGGQGKWEDNSIINPHTCTKALLRQLVPLLLSLQGS